MNGQLSLPPHEKSLALATKRAVQAAGGLKQCAEETGLSDSQLSRCCSTNHRDSITVRDAVTVDALGSGIDGQPNILRAMARELSCVVIPLPDCGTDAEGLLQSVMELTAELGDVAAAIRDALADTEVKPAEALAALAQLDELDQASAKLRLKLKGLAG